MRNPYQVHKGLASRCGGRIGRYIQRVTVNHGAARRNTPNGRMNQSRYGVSALQQAGG